MKNTYLSVKWSTSRGRETYGYNICTVTDGNTRKHYRCNGGGYDMLGTSFGYWMTGNFAERLKTLREENPKDEKSNYPFYGLSVYEGKAYTDGACGLSSMIEIADGIGLQVESLYGNRSIEGFYVTDTKEE